MSRFVKKKKRSDYVSLILSALIFACVITFFVVGINSLTKKAGSEQRSSLESALLRSVIECYAVEGAYPVSLSYLEENYSLTYNKEQFFVDYQPVGENIMPEITVIVKEANK